MQTKMKFGISLSSMFLLALLGVPRVIAHDLKWVESGDFVNVLLVFVPPIIWLTVVLRNCKDGVFIPLLTIGMIYGLLLGITHQILWTQAFDSPPVLGGNLSDIPPLVNAVIIRAFGFVSSLLTGAAIGLGLGVIGSAVRRVKR